MNSTTSFLGGLITGAVVGASLALLFAPAKGTETRAALKAKLDYLYEELKQLKARFAGGEAGEGLKERIDLLEEKIKQVMA